MLNSLTDYARRVVSSAAASATGGGPFPYAFDRAAARAAQPLAHAALWALVAGTRKAGILGAAGGEDPASASSSPASVSILAFDSARANRDKAALARNAVRRLKSTRHPAVLRFVDALEDGTALFVACEPARPLLAVLSAQDPLLIAWGLYRIASAVKFLNSDCALIHACIRPESIFVTPAGEWKLGGFELLSSLSEESPIIYDYGNHMPDSAKYRPPEIERGGWSIVKSNPISAVDAWGFACLIHEIFNGAFSRSQELGQQGKIPRELFNSYKTLLNPDPQARSSVAQFLEYGTMRGGYFDNSFVTTNLFLEEIHIKDVHEKEQFIQRLTNVIDTFPPEFCKFKMLPELTNAMEYGGVNPKVLQSILKIGSHLNSDDFETRIVPIIVKLFASADRGIRVTLCENMGVFVEKLSKEIINEKIFPNLAIGFTDMNPLIREHTVKSILLIIPKLSERTINTDLVPYFMRLQVDPEPGIRTNTIICLGKICKHFNESTRRKVIIPCFTRSLGDMFPPARNAALMAISATSDYYDGPDIATKLLPALCPLLIDTEKNIRQQALKSVNSLLRKVEKSADAMPDTAMKQQLGNANGQGQDAAGWAGWAVSTISKKITSTVDPITGGSAQQLATTSPTHSAGGSGGSPPIAPVTRSDSSSLAGGAAAPAPKGMVLGGGNRSNSIVDEILSPQGGAGGFNGWGGGGVLAPQKPLAFGTTGPAPAAGNGWGGSGNLIDFAGGSSGGGAASKANDGWDAFDPFAAPGSIGKQPEQKEKSAWEIDDSWGVEDEPLNTTSEAGSMKLDLSGLRQAGGQSRDAGKEERRKRLQEQREAKKASRQASKSNF